MHCNVMLMSRSERNQHCWRKRSSGHGQGNFSILTKQNDDVYIFYVGPLFPSSFLSSLHMLVAVAAVLLVVFKIHLRRQFLLLLYNTGSLFFTFTTFVDAVTVWIKNNTCSRSNNAQKRSNNSLINIIYNCGNVKYTAVSIHETSKQKESSLHNSCLTIIYTNYIIINMCTVWMTDWR